MNQLSEYVQFGCGFSAPEGWLSFDVSPTLRFERLPIIGRFYTRNGQRFPLDVRYGDIVKGLPIPDNSCLGIYCSHVLEHLAFDELDAALDNVVRHLKPGGTFRLVLPDLEQLARDYVTAKDKHASHRFMQDSGLGCKTRSHGLSGVLRTCFGNSAHLWMWDERSLSDKLGEHGFIQIRRASFGDAEDKQFNKVEDAGRFENCLALQCRKRMTA